MLVDVVEHNAGILDGCDDFAGVTNDAAILKKTLQLVRTVGRHPAQVEILETF